MPFYHIFFRVLEIAIVKLTYMADSATYVNQDSLTLHKKMHKDVKVCLFSFTRSLLLMPFLCQLHELSLCAAGKCWWETWIYTETNYG